jgi:hypothetical protein
LKIKVKRKRERKRKREFWILNERMKKSLFAAIYDPLSIIFSPSFAFLRVHSRFKNSLKDSALRAASPYRYESCGLSQTALP